MASTLEIDDNLLMHGAHVDIANATRHVTHRVKIWRHPQNQGMLCTSRQQVEN